MNYLFLIPLYNDWQSVNLLIKKINLVAFKNNLHEQTLEEMIKLKTIDYPFDELMGTMFNKGELIGLRTSQLLTYQDFQKNA